jgi:predicted anti-sigma-YlaC factor YlaD
MTCRKAAKFVDDFVDGQLNNSLKEEVQEHLDSCHFCRAETIKVVRLKELLSQYSVPDPGENYFGNTTDLILSRIFGQEQPVSRVH